MLKDESPWVLAVDWGTDSAAGVLERSPLSAAWENDDKSVSLRGMQDEETTLRDNAEKGFEEELLRLAPTSTGSATRWGTRTSG
jgi:hypothetical protein